MKVGNVSNQPSPKPRPKAANAPAPKLGGDLAPAGIVWGGASGGHKVSWTTADIRAIGADGKAISVKDGLRQDMHADELGPGATAKASARVKSLVNGVLSVQWSHDSFVPGDAHPDTGKAFRTFNLAKGGAPMKLTEIFPEEAIYKALMADAVVKQALGKAQPKDLAALEQALAYKTVKLKGHEYILDPELLSRFAIHHVEGTDAYVRLGLEAATGADREAFTQIGLKLRIPEDQRAGYQAAEAAGSLGRALDRLPAAKDMQAKYR
jgi:hypothetical protein